MSRLDEALARLERAVARLEAAHVGARHQAASRGAGMAEATASEPRRDAGTADGAPAEERVGAEGRGIE